MTVDERVTQISNEINQQMRSAIEEAVNMAVHAERQAWRDILIELGQYDIWRKALLKMSGIVMESAGKTLEHD